MLFSIGLIYFLNEWLQVRKHELYKMMLSNEDHGLRQEMPLQKSVHNRKIFLYTFEILKRIVYYEMLHEVDKASNLDTYCSQLSKLKQGIRNRNSLN